MILGVDIDNTIAKYTDGLSQAIFRQLKSTDLAAHRIAYPEPIDYSMSNWPGFPEAFFDLHTNAVEDGLYRSLDMIEEASEYLWKLSEQGHYLRIITSRFVKHGQNSIVVRDTGIWLDENNIPYRDIIFANQKTDIHCDVYIDDSPKNILELQADGKEVIIFNAPYNLAMPGRRAGDWKTVYDYIQEINSTRTIII